MRPEWAEAELKPRRCARDCACLGAIGSEIRVSIYRLALFHGPGEDGSVSLVENIIDQHSGAVGRGILRRVGGSYQGYLSPRVEGPHHRVRSNTVAKDVPSIKKGFRRVTLTWS